MPRPPICISIKITIWPNIVNWIDVSTTINPVTHTALVLVKNESTKLSQLPSVLDIGKDISTESKGEEWWF